VIRRSETTEAVSELFGRGGIVKICGLREPEHAAAAAAAGADLIGFVFAPARRRVSAAKASECVTAARGAAGDRTVLAVGVFVDATAVEIEEVALAAEIDLVQLHGSETPAFVQHLPAPAIKVLRPRPTTRPEGVIAEMDTFRTADRPPIAIMIEGHSDQGAGGTGTSVDWALAAEINAIHPSVLGGGLDAENVGEAIRKVRPLGVDVSSGVEKEGIKDPAKIEAFILAARAAFRS
jgi:phosphoribosylanthranilate isomerase